MRKTVGLIAFLKGNADPKVGMPGCANYDHHYGGCLFDERGCRVEKGERCSYFERAVLPTAFDIGCGESVLDQYQSRTKSVMRVPHKEVRRCSCGAILKPRQRFCDRCKRKRRSKAVREYRHRSRKSQRPSEQIADVA